MANHAFADLYISDCESCGAELEHWEWMEDEMRFHATCTCGTEYILEPTGGVISVDTSDQDDDYEEDDC